MKIRLLRFLLTILLLWALAASPALRGQTALVSFSGAASGTIRTDGNLTVGSAFTVGAQPITLTALGVWDQGGNGLITSHDVGIWEDTNPTALGIVTVPAAAAATLTGEFRYVDLATPLILQPNSTYRLGAWFDASSAEPFLDTGSGTISNAVYASVISTGLPVYSIGSSIAYPGSGVVYTNGYVGPGALYTLGAIPEPSTFCLLGGIIALAFAIRRRR